MRDEKDLKYDGIKGIPHISKTANSIKRNTGSWRVFKPVINRKKCTKCKICFTVCPDAAIKWVKGKPVIDYRTCKGCLVCNNECPVKAIAKVRDKHNK